MKPTKTYLACFFALLIVISCTPDQKNTEATYADYIADTTVVRGLDFKDYVTLTNSIKDTSALKETWLMWQSQEWTKLEAYIDSAKLNGKYPPAEGFMSVEVIDLKVGTELDRYNSIYGQFFAYKGADFGGRSLQAKDKYHPYTVYKVEKQIDSVLSGPAIPWFGQPGKGTQLMTQKHDNVLMNEGYLIMTDSVGPTTPPAN